MEHWEAYSSSNLDITLAANVDLIWVLKYNMVQMNCCFVLDIFKVYCADHTYTTLKLSYDASVDIIMAHAAEKLCLGDDLVMCEVKSNGGIH